MTYGKFAYLYDELMADVPYDKWVNMVINLKEKYEITGNKLLDLACGTGELSVRLTKAGFDVTGVDLSADMLTVAHEKGKSQGYDIPYLQQNMVELELVDRYDMIGIFCDSLNYLQTEEEVMETFEKVYHYLNPDGIFIFDVHSIYKILQVFMNQTFTYDQESICYIWNCFQGDYPNSVEHELTFFVQDEQSSKFDRYDEFHSQRTFPIETYRAWLEEIGFEVLAITADFEQTAPQNDSERIFFVLKK